MANSIFANRDQLLAHVITPIPLTDRGKTEFFEDFRQHGYIARQEYIGITVMPSLAGGSLWGFINEGNPEQPNQVKVVVLSHPTLTDDEFDNWVQVIRNWAASLDLDTLGAVSRTIRGQKAVDRGVSATHLNKDIPAALLLSYRRPSDFVMVVDTPTARKRRIYSTRDIG
jgi:hypothetical protein